MAVTPQEIKDLRTRTGLSVMDCKKALEDAEGDVEKALIILRKKSSTVAAKKSDRELGAGVVQAYIHSSNDLGAMVTLSCETDFVAKNEDFIALARDMAMHAAATAPRYIHKGQVKEEDVAKARELFVAEAADKPKNKRDAIVEGKMAAYLKEQVLMDQPFVKDPNTTIGSLIEQAVQKFGERIEITECVRCSARA